MDFHVSTNRRLSVTVEAHLAVGRLEDPAVSRGKGPIPMRGPPFALVGMAVGRPRPQHPIEPVIQILEDSGAPHACIIPCPANNDGIEQTDERLLGGMAVAFDDQPQLLDMALDRLGTGDDPCLVPQQTSPRVFGRPRFACWIMPDGKAKEGKAGGSLRYR